MVTKMKKDFFLLALAPLFVLGCQTTNVSTEIVGQYETPKYYGPIYPLTEAITLRYGEHPKTTFSVYRKDESHEGGKYKNLSQVLGGEITVFSFGPDLEWVIQILKHEGEKNGQKFRLTLSGAQVNLITSDMGEYKNLKTTVPTKIIQCPTPDTHLVVAECRNRQFNRDLTARMRTKELSDQIAADVSAFGTQQLRALREVLRDHAGERWIAERV